MLHHGTIKKSTLELLKELMSYSSLKDFIDIAYLSTELSLKEMLMAYENKYKSNPIMPLKALVYFDEINFDEPIKMTGNKSLDWKKIANRLKGLTNSPDKIFSSL